MPKKKKKGKKGKKKKEYLPPIYNIPAYEDPHETTPKVTIKLVLADPPVEALNQTVELPINTKLEYLVKKIKDKHEGAVADVSLYTDATDKTTKLDLDKKIEDSGLKLTAEIVLYYDFKPVTYPILF